MSQLYRLRKKQESHGKKLFMLTVEYIQRTEGTVKEDKNKVFFELDGRWKKICVEAKHAKRPVLLSPDTFNVHLNDFKAMNDIRKRLFGMKLSMWQKFKALIQQDA